MLLENVILECEKRASTGKNAARRLRAADMIPAVLYGGGKDVETISLAVARKPLQTLLRKGLHGNAIFQLRLKGTDQDRHVMIRDLTVHPVSRAMLHVDFVRILLDRKLRVRVPIEVQGIASGVKNKGGLLNVVTHEIEVECLPADIPPSILVDVTNMDLHESLRVSDLKLDAKLKLREHGDRVLVHIELPKVEEVAAVAAPEVATAAEPEVIKKGKKEEEAADEKGAKPAEKGAKPEDATIGQEGEEVIDSDLALVAGLGNPGDRYTGTRHNVGFDVVDALARRASDGAGARVDRLDCRALTARVRLAALPLILAKPQTFMNLSGESVKGLAAKYEIPPERILIVADEVALPLGRIRIRPSGSSAGQKGLQNVLDCFRTNAVPRLRIGIRGERFQEGSDRADYVLDRFSKGERKLVEAAVEAATEAVEVWRRDGIEAAMNRFNRTVDDAPEAGEVTSAR